MIRSLLMLIYVLFHLFLISTSMSYYTPIPIDCNSTGKELSGPSCEAFSTNYLQYYTSIGSNSYFDEYNKNVIPVNLPQENFTDSMTQVYMRLTLIGLKEVNEGGSYITLSTIVDTWWVDEFVFWNESLTPGAETVHVPSDWVWNPNIQLYNSENNYDAALSDTPLTITSHVENYKSDIWQTCPGVISSSCVMTLDDFPFDSQLCTLVFASFLYQYETGGLNISLATIEPETGLGYYVTDDFHALSWEVTSIRSYTGMEHEYGNMAAVYYEIGLQRDSTFYVYTAIIPNIVITMVAMASMWIPHVVPRLSVSITAMLAVIAMMWTVSAELPQTENPTWLASFCIQCVATVAVVCIESCVVAFLVTKKGDIPLCAKFMIRFSKSYLYIIHGSSGKTSKRSRGNTDPSTGVGVGVVEMVAHGDEENLMEGCSSSSNSNIGTSKTSTLTSMGDGQNITQQLDSVLNVDMNSSHLAPDQDVGTDEDDMTDENIDINGDGGAVESEPLLVNISDGDDSARWAQLTRAMDRVLRVGLPIFSVTLIILKLNGVHQLGVLFP